MGTDANVLPQLNEDCLVRIFQLFPPRERIRLECICKLWKNDIVPASLWKVKSLELVKTISAGHNNWEILHIPCSVLVDPHQPITVVKGGYRMDNVSDLEKEAQMVYYARRLLRRIVDRFGDKLESVCFSGVPLPWAFDMEELNMLKEKCPHLKRLDLDVHVSATALHWLGKQLNGLESLNYRHCQVSVSCYSSTAAEFHLENSLKYMTNLKNLSITAQFGNGRFLCNLPKSIVAVSLKFGKIDNYRQIQPFEQNVAEMFRSHPALKFSVL